MRAHQPLRDTVLVVDESLVKQRQARAWASLELTRGDEERARAAGFDDSLAKPVEGAALDRLLGRA